MRLRLFASTRRLSQFRLATILAAIGLTFAGSGFVRPASAAKPGGTLAAYAVTDLGAPRYRNWHLYWGRAYGINEPDANNQGLMDVIGWDWDNLGSAVWEVGASAVSRRDLGTGVRVTAVNDGGRIVGVIGDADHLFAEVPGVGMVALPGSAGFSPAAVNNLGHVVSQRQQPGYPEFGNGAMWTVMANGSVSGPVDLESFRPLDINDSGVMAGLQDSVAAIAWFEGVLLRVTKLPGLWAGGLGVATAINNQGDVVGYSTSSRLDSGTYSPFLWTSSQGLKALGSLGGIHGKALGINDSGKIVGFSYTYSPRNSEQRAFLWDNNKMFDLNGLVTTDKNRTLQSADGINNAGHIIGSGYTLYGKTTTLKSFLLSPTP